MCWCQQHCWEPDLVIEYVTHIAELAKIDGSIAGAWRPTCCTGHILQHASEEQKQKYFALVISGEWISLFRPSPTRAPMPATCAPTAVLDESGENYTVAKTLPTATGNGRGNCAHRRSEVITA
jgi:alkylation response protein AidB-like acyl-CoA dehydrogenase